MADLPRAAAKDQKSSATYDPSKCLVFKNKFADLFFIPDRTQIDNERQKILAVINEKVEALDMQSITDPSLKLASRNAIYELQSVTQRLAYLNERYFSNPILPNEPTSGPIQNEVELLLSERNFLNDRILSLEQEIQNYRQSFHLINQSIGSVSQPTSKNSKTANLLAERNLRIRVICNTSQFHKNLFDRKRKRLRFRVENLAGLAKEGRCKANFLCNEAGACPKLSYVERKIEESLANYLNLIEMNRHALMIIDNEIQKIDKPFHDRLAAIDFDMHHLFCKRKMFAKKLMDTQKLLNLTNDRIKHIDKRLESLASTVKTRVSEDLRKIDTCLKIGLGMDEDGSLASALQNNAEKRMS